MNSILYLYNFIYSAGWLNVKRRRSQFMYTIYNTDNNFKVFCGKFYINWFFLCKQHSPPPLPQRQSHDQRINRLAGLHTIKLFWGAQVRRPSGSQSKDYEAHFWIIKIVLKIRKSKVADRCDLLFFFCFVKMNENN